MATLFAAWYESQHGYTPFPWQERLADLIASGTPPASIAVPTGAGKTAIIAAWHWATLNGYEVPTRLVYVVDRRLIVDSVSDYAERLGCNVVKMRGGTTIDNSWLMSPVEPSVIVSTVDQAGSRLLWRGYGVSPNAAPIHAALIGNDAMIVLDEAHISTPFASTLASIDRLRLGNHKPWHFVTMTATPTNEGPTLELSDADYRHPALSKRLANHKLAQLVKVDRDQFAAKMVIEAERLQQATNGVVGVICNTTRYARTVFERLSGDKVLLTGRIRPADKDAILVEYLPRMLSGSRGSRKPLYVVATQTIEVGADLDFDALVTQNAPLDALRQRFGRLDRLGEQGVSRAVIIHENLKGEETCPIYGRTLLTKTWTWLTKSQTGKGKDKTLDFGIMAMREAMGKSPPPLRDEEPVLPFTAQSLRLLRQTVPPVPTDIAPWLHGDRVDDISVMVVWRADLQGDTKDWVDIKAAAPPVMAEAMPCPVYEVRKWLGGRPVIANDKVIDGNAIQPGDVLVIPTEYGGYGKWGWDPTSQEPVEDIGNKVGNRVRLIGADVDTDIKACLTELGISFRKPIAVAYPAGLVVTEANPRRNGHEVELEVHLQGVEAVAKQLTNDSIIHDAARLHDAGKQDPRFQVVLGARDRVLAKSSHVSQLAARVAREWSGLPDGWRHEVASLALLPEDSPDLLRYLVATHHGNCRAVLPIGGDETLWMRAGGPRWGNLTESLNEEHGAWGLAYFEALVRLSDWIRSQQEQKDAL